MHVILPTHTTLHLRRTLLGLACQTRPADSITISCDGDQPAIRDLVRLAAPDLALDLTLIQRPHQGVSRSAQVRNNAVRHLLSRGAGGGGSGGRGARPEDRLVFFDGDCCPAPDALSLHERLGPSPDALVVGFRIDLTPEQTDAFSESALRAGSLPVQPTPAQLAALRARHRRYLRHALLRRLRLVKPHKPKLLSANFSVSLDLFQRINGFDESYQGYGQEDDDFGRRAYRAGARPVIAVARILVFHLYHPTRAPGDWSLAPNAARFRLPFTVRCPRGLTIPAVQPEPVVSTFPASAKPPGPTIQRAPSQHPAHQPRQQPAPPP